VLTFSHVLELANVAGVQGCSWQRRGHVSRLMFWNAVHRMVAW